MHAKRLSTINQTFKHIRSHVSNLARMVIRILHKELLKEQIAEKYFVFLHYLPCKADAFAQTCWFLVRVIETSTNNKELMHGVGVGFFKEMIKQIQRAMKQLVWKYLFFYKMSL